MVANKMTLIYFDSP